MIKKFLFIPLPDINSTALSALRDIIGQHHFIDSDINKAADEVIQSKAFKTCFALRENMTESFINITQKNTKNIIHELLELAGPEAKKWIYMKEKDTHDIHKTTLEKHAIKLGLIESHQIIPEHFKQEDQHKKIILKLNFQNKDHLFHNLMRFSGKQHRGRG